MADEPETSNKQQEVPTSPRAKFIYTKFKQFDGEETVLANYACAAKC
jgi:hypothetical protein